MGVPKILESSGDRVQRGEMKRDALRKWVQPGTEQQMDRYIKEKDPGEDCFHTDTPHTHTQGYSLLEEELGRS